MKDYKPSKKVIEMIREVEALAEVDVFDAIHKLLEVKLQIQEELEEDDND